MRVGKVWKREKYQNFGIIIFNIFNLNLFFLYLLIKWKEFVICHKYLKKCEFAIYDNCYENMEFLEFIFIPKIKKFRDEKNDSILMDMLSLRLENKQRLWNCYLKGDLWVWKIEVNWMVNFWIFNFKKIWPGNSY